MYKLAIFEDYLLGIQVWVKFPHWESWATYKQEDP